MRLLRSELNDNTAMRDGSLKHVTLQVHCCPQVASTRFGYVTLTHIGKALWFKIAKHCSYQDYELGFKLMIYNPIKDNKKALRLPDGDIAPVNNNRP